jgi:hypothetical protein
MHQTSFAGTLARTAGIVFLPLLLLAGCGGTQDYGGFSRGLGGDIGNSYNSSLGGRYGGDSKNRNVATERGAYPMIETSFQLASVPGDPFDYEKVNVQVELRKPEGGAVEVPAFFDGGTTWRMRYTPTTPGQYSVVGVKLNKETAHEEKLEKKDWTVNGSPQPGFVRIDKGDHHRFVFDNGSRYFPLGHNQGWKGKDTPEIPDLFGKMHAAGENWSRVWMTAWDGKNLDWPASGKPGKLGDIDLAVAKKWDAIVEAAGKNDIYFQMVLQHHGQYSSKEGYKYSGNVNPNWDTNPYSTQNGGFLRSPEEFFTNPQARALTRRKLYYILARWGYSPSIMAFELFNEVENTDAAHGKLWDDIAMWHREMALFLHQFDGYRHLVTTSAVSGVPLESPVWETVDYVQIHTYPSDIITALGGGETSDVRKKLDKPIFVGEFGASNLQDPEGVSLHTGLWASLMSGRSGAAQYWDWESIDKHDLYAHFQAASGFLTASGMAGHGGLATTLLPVETSQKADLRFGPGGGWGSAGQNEFVVGTNGAPPGMDRYPAFLQGQAHIDMTPKPLTFQVSYAQPGAFTVRVGQVAKSGAHLKVSVDGKASERAYPAKDSDYTPAGGQETVQVEVPAGAHTVTLENTGKDWVNLRQFTLTNYASALAAHARIGKDFAAAWIYHRANVDAPAAQTKEQSSATGRLTLPGIQPGRYRATWWDTHAGKSLDATDLTVANAKEGASLSTPPITRDVALYIVKAGTPPATTAKNKKEKKGANSAYAAPYAPATSTTGATSSAPTPE